MAGLHSASVSAKRYLCVSVIIITRQIVERAIARLATKRVAFVFRLEVRSAPSTFARFIAPSIWATRLMAHYAVNSEHFALIAHFVTYSYGFSPMTIISMNNYTIIIGIMQLLRQDF